MWHRRVIEISVGLLMLIAIGALVMLSFKVSGLNTVYNDEEGYTVRAYFNNVGGLKARSRVSVAGVVIGRVKSITLDLDSYEAMVTLFIRNSTRIPKDSSAGIMTSGLLGDNYIAIEPGADEAFLANGDVIEETHSALILERLIGQFLFDKNK